MTSATLSGLLRERFAAVGFRQTADEVRPFLSDPRELDLWPQEFFDEAASRWISA